MTTPHPLISVIVPVYNCAAYLPQCLESILVQTHNALEIILIDDGSADDSPQICDTFAQKDPRIKVIHQTNQGVSAARNTGLALARGEYIGFVDADDFIAPDMYAYLYDLIERDKADIAMCNLFLQRGERWVNSGAITDEYRLIKNTTLFDIISWRFLVQKLFRRSALHGRLFRRDVSYAEDALFVFQTITNCSRIALGNGPKYYYRQNQQSATHRFNKKHLKQLDVEQQIMDYARENQLPNLYRQAHVAQMDAVGTWLKQLAQQEETDNESVKKLVQFVRKNWKDFISTAGIKCDKKCFVFVAYVHFALAKRLYRRLRK